MHEVWKSTQFRCVISRYLMIGSHSLQTGKDNLRKFDSFNGQLQRSAFQRAGASLVLNLIILCTLSYSLFRIGDFCEVFAACMISLPSCLLVLADFEKLIGKSAIFIIVSTGTKFCCEIELHFGHKCNRPGANASRKFEVFMLNC